MPSIVCRKCGNNNPPEVRFCISCGAELRPAPAFSPPTPPSVAEEIRQLRELLAVVSQRLDVLEGKQELPAAPPPPVSIPVYKGPEVIKPKPAPAPVPVEAVKPTAAAPAATVEQEAPPRQPNEWEQVLGGSWLARIGVLALIIGIGFFLKYAFDNNWIGPAARVIVGVVIGLFMLGLGNWWRTRYPILTRVLSGGGVAVLYLSIFASFATYHLISIYLAVLLLLAISVIAALLARRYESMVLAILGIIGAFFAPFILGAFEAKAARAGGSGQAVQLLVYIIVIDLGVLLLSTIHNWRWFTLLSLGCSLITYGFWYDEFHRQVSIATAELGITAVFLIFVGATSLFHIIWRRIPRAFDYVLMLVTAAAYFGISLGLMWDHFRAWMGGFALLLAIFYGLLAYFTYRRSPDNTRLSLFALGVGLVFLTAAVPIQLGDKAWATIVWAAEFTLMMWLSFRLEMPALRSFSFAVFLAMVLRLLAFDTPLDTRTATPFLNERFLAFIIAIAATYLSIYILWRHRESFADWRAPASALTAFANFLSVWILSFEVWQAFSNPIRNADPASRVGLGNAQNLALTAVWTIYAVGGLVIGIWKHWRAVRVGALCFLAVPIIKVFVYDVFKLETSYRIGAFVGLGVLLLASAYLYQRYSKIIKGVFTEK